VSTSSYSYLVTDLRSNLVLAELPMTGVSYSNVLSGTGDFSGSVYIDPAYHLKDLKEVTYPGRVGLYILRDTTCQWGGILWKRSYDSTSRKISLQGQTFESYMERRFQSQTLSFSQTDQLLIAQRLIDVQLGPIHVEIDQSLSGVLRDRNMFWYEYKTIGKELSDLANLENGFEYNIKVSMDPTGAFQRKLVFGYPQLGMTASQTPHVFDYPGNISDFALTEDAVEGANNMTALGAGEGVELLTSHVQDVDQARAGYPPLEASRSYRDVTQPSTLLMHSSEDLRRLRSPVTVYSVNVRADQEPEVGTYSVGDYARFRIEDDWVNPMIDDYWRITKYAVSVDDQGGPEKISLTLGGNEVGNGSV
jgi:hypothetical protein